MSRCPYLKGCLANNFAESQSEIIVLDDVLPGAIEIVLEYIYTKRVQSIVLNGNDTRDFDFVDAYILADRFCMESLKNLLMDRLRVLYAAFQPSVKAFRTFTERGLDGSLLEDYMLEISAWSLSQNEGTVDEVTGLGELVEGGRYQVLRLFDLAREMENDEDAVDPQKNDKCHYHYHTDTKPCHESGNKRKRDDLDGDGPPLTTSAAFLKDARRPTSQR